jgi:hypothetical protein
MVVFLFTLLQQPGAHHAGKTVDDPEIMTFIMKAMLS